MESDGTKESKEEELGLYRLCSGCFPSGGEGNEGKEDEGQDVRAVGGPAVGAVALPPRARSEHPLPGGGGNPPGGTPEGEGAVLCSGWPWPARGRGRPAVSVAPFMATTSHRGLFFLPH